MSRKGRIARKEDVERDNLKVGETQCVWVASSELGAVEWLKGPALT